MWLLYHSKPQTIGSLYHKDLTEKYPDVLGPVSRETSAPQEEVDRAALQDSYKNTLSRLGLMEERDSMNSFEISALGSLLVRYIDTKFGDDNES